MSQINSLQLLIKVIKVLSHKVRNPLSVISNDLNYLQLLDPNQDCQRSIDRCREISEYFKPIEILDSSAPGQFNLTQLVAEVFECEIANEQELLIFTNYNNLKQALSWLKNIIPVLRIEQTETTIFKFLFKDAGNSNYSSINNLYAALEKEQSVLPLLIDAILENTQIELVQQPNFFELRVTGQ